MMPFQALLVGGLLPRRLLARRPGSFEAFVAETVALARELRPGPAEADYLRKVAAAARGLEQIPEVELGPPFLEVMRSGVAHRGGGILLLQWEMDANTIYPPHDHPGYAGLTLGLAGRCRMCNFDIVGEPPPRDAKAPFRVRKTQDATLVPGSVASLVSTARDNIHTLGAGPEGARGLDVITQLGEDPGFTFLDLEKVSHEKDIFEARRVSVDAAVARAAGG